MTAATSTLTDRYVDATLRRLPAEQRPDIERELRASIADAVEDRIAGGDDATDAEYAVLTKLGDPARLAAGYADRPLHLIGPALYLDYTRLLTALLVIVVPVVASVVGFTRILEDGSAGDVIGAAISAAINTTVHIVFWTTLLFAVIERVPSLHGLPARQWTPDALPITPDRRARYATLIAEIVAVVLFAAFVLLSPVISPEKDAGGGPIGILSPWLWQTGVVYLFLVLAFGSVGITVAKNYVSWNAPLAIAAAGLSIASATLLIWVAANDRLLNPAFIQAAEWPSTVAQWINLGLILAATIAVVQAVVETVAGFVARSWVRPNWNTMTRTITEGITTRSRP